MKFEFGKYTDITALYKKHSEMLTDGDGYINFYICNDTNDFWLARVLKGLNSDYEEEEGVFLLEREMIGKTSKSESLSLSRVKQIIIDDDFSNWDVYEYTSLEELIDDLDGGFGIN